ncbi:MAG: hypothetical protein PHS32_06245 [Rhodoferax sp.]|uniref:Nmad2 family putative nucleotide modification protein n=1 Tax=Rhodoferax sp. TaxID=50421 RepID=UPI0026035C25|nr:hypothetical protein [Rhodoferax sp.]MDD5333331.1 hypothetical protein [Rhodoferax sp.]
MIDQKKTKVCAYVMTVDSGFAPNPFHGVCTLAVCTPNHMRANLGIDDWIVGIAGQGLRSRLGKSDQWKIIYAMKIGDRQDLDSYYNHPAYLAKIPKLIGSRIEMCGDNFYRRTPEGIKHTRQTNNHEGDFEKQDTNGDRVFIGTEFYYFGSLAIELPQNESWSKLIVQKFQNCAVGLRYLLGGSSRERWGEDEFEKFRDFLKQRQLNWIPNPKDFPPMENPKNQNTCHSKCA